RYSTPRKPAFAAAAKRSRNSTSLNSMVKLAANFGMASVSLAGAASVEQRDGGRRVARVVGQILEFGDLVDLDAHRDIGHALQDDLDDHWRAELLHPTLRALERVGDPFRVGHADRLAAEPFGNLDVIDAVDAELGRVDVLERQLHRIVHIESALGLADEPEIGIVHHHMDIGQLELSPHRQLFDHELKIVVAGDGDDLAVRVRRPHAERGRDGPAERARLAAVDPMARLVNVQELGGGDLRQADGRDIADVLAEDLVHLFVDPLRLDRRFREVRSTQHRLLSLAAFAEPLAPVLQGLLRLQLARGLDEQFERGLGVRDDPEIGIEDATDLRRLDVDMNELAPFGVDVDRSGVTIGPAIAHAKHEVGLEHRRVAVAVDRLQP